MSVLTLEFQTNNIYSPRIIDFAVKNALGQFTSNMERDNQAIQKLVIELKMSPFQTKDGDSYNCYVDGILDIETKYSHPELVQNQAAHARASFDSTEKEWTSLSNRVNELVEKKGSLAYVEVAVTLKADTIEKTTKSLKAYSAEMTLMIYDRQVCGQVVDYMQSL